MPAPAPSPEPAAPAQIQPILPSGPVAAVGLVLTAAAEQVSRVVRPEAAVAVATEFGFPLILTVAVLAFLLIQGYVDRRDPKLRMAPHSSVEQYVKFAAEDDL